MSAEDADNVDPSTLRAAHMYGGAQGIWVDKKTTDTLAKDGHGVTVAILHTGRHYPDDLSEDGLIYHYPTTHRQPGRDAAEIQATKNAASHSLPIFVILPGTNSSAKRSVRLGWVVDFDDENRQFLILFGKDEPKYQPPPSADMPFALTGGQTPGKTTAKTRPGQQRFRFQVLSKYGCKCAVCAITHRNLMKAAHICGKAHNGSDDWRNGLPLCSTHHDAFDAYLFVIQPKSLIVETMPGVSPLSIGITAQMLSPIRGQPHSEALSWRFSQTKKRWAMQNETGREERHHQRRQHDRPVERDMHRQRRLVVFAIAEFQVLADMCAVYLAVRMKKATFIAPADVFVFAPLRLDLGALHRCQFRVARQLECLLVNRSSVDFVDRNERRCHCR